MVNRGSYLGLRSRIDIANIFTPEIVLPEQQAESAKISPYHSLALAVLEDAVNCLLSVPLPRAEQKIKLRRGRQWQADWEWLNSDEYRPFSFTWVCEVVGFLPAAVRGSLTLLVSKGGRESPGNLRCCPGCGSKFVPALSKPNQVFCKTLCSGRGSEGESPINWNRSGLCVCECGEATPLAEYTSLRLGWLIGRPIWYVPGHGRCKIRGERRNGKRSGKRSIVEKSWNGPE